MDVFLLILSLIVLILGWTWMLVPAFYGLPSLHTRRGRIRKALQLAELKPDEVLYDLGAGDGRVLVIAAKEFEAQAVGIEVGPVQCAAAWVNALANGVRPKVRVKRDDFFKADLSAADVVFIYATSRQAVRLEKQLAAQLRPGARVVTISFDFPHWEPAGFDQGELIFLYKMPPQPGDLTSFLSRR
ncbi:MAG TPA: 50S ribosomal protein L11 methyltransferase [Anaerolineales bacterium]|jgi:SAM-dependent methyltransferase